MYNDNNKVIFNLLRVGAFLQREGNRITEKIGINQQQFVVLSYINEHELVSQKEICKSLFYEKSNVSKIIKRLEKRGLVEKKSSRGDLRYSHINCTPKGQQMIADCYNDFDKFNNDFLGSLSNDELKSISDTSILLNHLIRNKKQ